MISKIPVVRVNVCKEFPPHSSYWYEVEVALDEDDDEGFVVETDGMYETQEEAQQAGDAWAASPKGQETIANVFAARRRALRTVLNRLLARVNEPDAPDGEERPW